MTAKEAVIAVLHEAGRPLRISEIMERIVAQKLWQTSGKTPEATLQAQLAVDIKKKGAASQFIRTAPGTYYLRESAGTVGEEQRTGPEPSAVPAQPAKSMMTFTEAAEHILEKFSRKRPMYYKDIAEKVMELGLVRTEGKTPEATLFAQILTDISRRAKRGDPPRFTKHGKGYVGLAKWEASGLGFQIRQHNQSVKKQLKVRLMTMAPDDFEALVGTLLVNLGFENVEVTKASGDGGIDVRGTLVVGDVIQTRMAVQVKRWKKNVQAPIVQQVRGSLGAHEQGLIITTSDFSSGAVTEASQADKIPWRE